MRKVIIYPLIAAIFSQFCYAIEVERNIEVNFIVAAPAKVYANKPFKATIKAVDDNNKLVRDYNIWGPDLEVVTSSQGEIRPAYIPASVFKKGIARIYFTYSEEGKIDIFLEPIVKEERKPKGLYTIAPFDLIKISVWEAEGLTQEIAVSPDGDIFFPLIGQIKAQGLTLKELADLVTVKIAEYVRDPQVTVELKKMHGTRVVVMGEVEFPGVYKLENSTLMEAIAAAEGFTKDAVETSVVIMRGDLATQPEVKIVNLRDVVKKGKYSNDIYLQPNDVVYVPEKFVSNYHYFMTRIFPGLSPTTYILKATGAR